MDMLCDSALVTPIPNASSRCLHLPRGLWSHLTLTAPRLVLHTPHLPSHGHPLPQLLLSPMWNLAPLLCSPQKPSCTSSWELQPTFQSVYGGGRAFRHSHTNQGSLTIRFPISTSSATSHHMAHPVPRPPHQQFPSCFIGTSGLPPAWANCDSRPPSRAQRSPSCAAGQLRAHPPTKMSFSTEKRSVARCSSSQNKQLPHTWVLMNSRGLAPTH